MRSISFSHKINAHLTYIRYRRIFGLNEEQTVSNVLRGIVYLSGCIVLLTGMFLATVDAAPKKALFIYWRGMTDCGKGLKSGLKELNIDLDIHEFDAEQDVGKLHTFLSTLDEKSYAFIYTFGTTASLVVSRQIKHTPILFGIVTNPVKSGLIKSWESSGNNITGVSHAISYRDQVEFILRLGNLKKIGMIFNAKEQNSQIANEELKALFQQKNIPFVSIPVSSKIEIDGAVSQLISKKADLVYLPSDSFIVVHSKEIITRLNRSNVATYGALEEFIANGAMIGVVSSYEKVGRELSKMAQKVLEGKSPSAIPSIVLPFDDQTVFINGQTVKSIGATIPFDILRTANIKE